MEKHFSCSTQESRLPLVLSSDGQEVGVRGGVGRGFGGRVGLKEGERVGGGVGIGVRTGGTVGRAVGGRVSGRLGISMATGVGSNVPGDGGGTGQPGVGNIHVHESFFPSRQVSKSYDFVP